MMFLALYRPNQETSLLGLEIASNQRQYGWPCDLTVFDKKYKDIFRWVYEIQGGDSVYIMGDAEAEKKQLLYCTKYGAKEYVDIELVMFDPDHQDDMEFCHQHGAAICQ